MFCQKFHPPKRMEVSDPDLALLTKNIKKKLFHERLRMAQSLQGCFAYFFSLGKKYDRNNG
jgi:hypothetical protein